MKHVRQYAILVGMLVGIGLVVCVSVRGATPNYVFVTLTVPGAANTDAWDINDDGVIVGHYLAGDVTHGFVRTTNGKYYTIDVPGATFTQVTGINERGEIVGTYRLPDDSTLHAYLLSKWTFRNIDVPTATSSLPRGINKHGDIALEAVIAGHTTAYLLSNGAYLKVEPSASFAGAPVTFSYASGINKHGAIVGRYDSAGTNRGFLLDQAIQSQNDEAYTTVHFPDATSSAALGINKKGVIAGGYTKDGIRHGYVLIDDVYTTLDVPGCSSAVVAGAMTCTTPRKINAAGQVVGFYGAGGNAMAGFLANPQ